jgi:hypothetical protein
MAQLPAPRRSTSPQIGQTQLARLQRPGRLPYVGNVPLRRGFDDVPTETPAERQLIDYCTMIGQRDGLLPADVTAIDAIADLARATVWFVAADATQREIAEITVPAHVMAFDPEAAPRALPAPSEKPAD